MPGNSKADKVHGGMPMIIGPWTYFRDLEDDTGDTISTPEFLMRWALQDESRKVTITQHLIWLDTGDRCPEDAADGTPKFLKSDIVIDGVPVADLAAYGDVRLDYCAYCVRERGCSRLETLTSPRTHDQQGDGRVISYECAYGHNWRC